MDLDAAQRAFALVRSLDTEKPLPPPSVLTVFRLYCMEELSAAQVARNCHCSKPTILRRLKLIEKRTGIAPQQLRRLLPHIAKLEDKLRDPAPRASTPKPPSTRKTTRTIFSKRKPDTNYTN